MSGNAGGVVLALLRSVASLRAPRIWAYVVAPAAAALLVWLALAVYAMGSWAAWMLAAPPLSWLVAWDLPGLAGFLAMIGAWLLALSLSYLTASLLAAVFILPLLLEWLAAGEYADLARMGEDGVMASLSNSLAAVAIYLVVWLVSLPLWLIPGVALVLPVLLLAALNRRTFAYDALVAHASRDEWRELRARHGRSLFALGLVLSLLAHIPIVGLLVPTLSALAFLHYGFEALRQLRQGAVIAGSGVRVADDSGTGAA